MVERAMGPDLKPNPNPNPNADPDPDRKPDQVEMGFERDKVEQALEQCGGGLGR